MHKSKHSTLMEVTVPQGWKLVPIEPTDAMLLAGYSDVHNAEIWWDLMLDAAPAAPVASPPDLTQQTLDDLMAGIPARDAEIEALRKQIETLQAQLQSPVNVHSNMCRGIIAPITFDILAHVLGDDSGNSGELDYQSEYEAFKDAAWNKSGSPIGRMDGKNAAWLAWVNRAALAQQDTNKVNALPPLNDDLIAILGWPNFLCPQLADTLRSGGQEIARCSENEQAAVIHFLLGHYLADPAQWAKKASAAFKAARKETDE